MDNQLTLQRSAPIGVFDSGMGGLTVLSALMQAMPDENFVYLGDTARLPYGTKSPATVVRYAEQAAGVLVQRGVRALVVACNTASGLALEQLTRRFAPLPVFGVVEPGARAAAAAGHSEVLVLATESTVRGGAYQRTLHALNPTLRVHARACPLWVTLAEQGPESPDVVKVILKRSLRGFDDHATTLLLGCTHFPVFREALAAMVPGATIVDSAATTAQYVVDGLADAAGAGGAATPTRTEKARTEKARTERTVTFLATDGVSRFRRVGSHFLGTEIRDVELVDL